MSPAPAPVRRSESQSFSAAAGTNLIPDADLRDKCLINPVTSALACDVKCPQGGRGPCLLSECLNSLPSSAPHQLASTYHVPGPLPSLFYKELHEPRYSGFQQMANPLTPCFVIGGLFSGDRRSSRTFQWKERKHSTRKDSDSNQKAI